MPCNVLNTLQGRFYAVLMLNSEVVNAALEQKLFLVAVDINAGIRAYTLCMTHLTEYTAVRRNDTLDSAH